MPTHPFRQVDVFSREPLRGNPVAVVDCTAGHEPETAVMQAFASWTNLSETTFLLAPTDERADYRLRIFTPAEELPFAGHPTLGSAHAWLEGGGVPVAEGELVQECGAGLVTLRRGTGLGSRLSFAAPPLRREGPLSEAERATVLAALRVSEDDVLDAAWIDNGPGWAGVLLRDADAVLALRPDWTAFGGIEVGVAGLVAAPVEDGPRLEVRAFCPSLGVVEDPVTGSLNASLGQWLTASGRLPDSYVARQGTVLGRAGLVHVERDGDQVWVGGDTTTVLVGEAHL